MTISIDGEVGRPLRLDAAELSELSDGELVGDFHCREGWTRPGERWRGVRLATLLAAALPREEARFVTVGAGGYTVVLPRAQAEDERVLLALERNGLPLDPSDGLPRLVGPSDWDCFLSVKGVDRIVLTREPAEATAETIALARLAR